MRGPNGPRNPRLRFTNYKVGANFFLLFIVLGSILVFIPGLAAAQFGRWTEPFEVSPPVPVTPVPLNGLPTPATPVATPTPEPVDPKNPRYGSSWFPDLAIGPNGSTHIIWYSGIAANSEAVGSLDLLMYRELRNGKWTPFNNISVPATGGYTVRNSIVMGRDGRLHVIYRSGTDLMYMNAPWDNAWSAQSWSQPRTIGNSAYYTELATDTKGGLHAFWSGTVIDDPQKPRAECPNCSDLFYRSSTDGGLTWSAQINLSQSDDGENRPQVQVDPQDRIHVVWDQGIDWYVGRGVAKRGVYRRSDDGGKTWSEPVLLGPSDDTVKQVTLGVDNNGNPLVVYRSATTPTLYYQYSRDQGRTWSPASQLPGIMGRNLNDNDLDKYSLDVDAGNTYHLVMPGMTSLPQVGQAYQLQLMHLTWNGISWSPPDNIMANDLYPEWPTITISNGNQMHVVWFTRSQDDIFRSEKARYRVWYSTRQLTIPAVREPPLFTPVPTMAPTALPTETPIPPSPTPLPPEIAQSPILTGTPAWEASGIVSVLAAVLPVIAILSIVLGIRWLLIRRRIERGEQ